MHDNFADWYRLVTIDPYQIDLDKRWRGIENFIKKIKKPNILDIVKQFFGNSFQSTDSEHIFRSAFKKTDEAFPMRGNEVEMQVLAGATIAKLLNSGDVDLADSVALAVVCIDFQGLRKKQLLDEIVELARTYLFERSNGLRTNLNFPSIAQIQSKAPTIPNDGTAAGNASQIAKLIQPAINTLNDLPNKLISQINDAILKLAKQLLLQQEESNMLWWLFATHSRDIKKKISEIDINAASLVVGKELSDLTLVIPGPVAAEAFMNKMLESAKNFELQKTTVKQAISSSMLNQWKIDLLQITKLDLIYEFCPVNFAIKQSVEFENSTEWETKFSKLSGITPDQELLPSILALQMYRERLLIKSMQ